MRSEPTGHEAHTRPAHLPEQPVPPIPDIDLSSELAATTLSHFRTQLSTHRTTLSEHRTSLSEYRTDLSGDRTELSMRRTGMSFQRTRMSADRTLMSVIRTALSLIGFGFTIYQVFAKMFEANVIANSHSARNLGLALVGLGIALLVLGIVYHVQFMIGLRHIRKELVDEGLLHGESRFPPSLTLVTALILLGIGIVAIVNMLT
jgi:uncharacterized membrane protein YidH (DUF202 family)